MEFLPAYFSLFFNWLLETSVMAGILGIIVLLVRFLFKNLGIRWQNALWFLLIVRLLLPITPQTSFSLYNLFPINSSPITKNNLQSPQIISGISSKLTNPSPEVGSGPNQTNQSSSSGQPDTPSSARKFSFVDIMLMVWFTGVLGLAGYVFLWHRRFLFDIAGEAKTAEANITTFSNRCREIMEIKQPVQVFLTSKVLSPTLFGFVRPRLLLPEETTNLLSEEQLKYVFLHELSHLKRKDILLNWVSTILLVIHWFNPILWVAFHKMREDQEIACDALALTFIDPSKAKEYGFTIIKLLETCSRPLGLPITARLLGGNSGIKRRIEMIKLTRGKSLKTFLIGLSLIAIIGIVSLTNAKSNASPSTDNLKGIADVKNISLKVAEIYKEDNPKIARVNSTQTEVTLEPMYIVFLSGNFQKGNLTATNISFSVLANGQKVWALRAFDSNNRDIWQDAEVNLDTTDLAKSNMRATNAVDYNTNPDNSTALMENFLKDRGYTVLSNSLAGTSIQLPSSFNAIVNGANIGEFLTQKNELSKKQNNLDFSKYLGEKVSLFTWGLEGTANFPHGSNVFFLTYNGQIVGVWFDPVTNDGQKDTTLSVLEQSLSNNSKSSPSSIASQQSIDVNPLPLPTAAKANGDNQITIPFPFEDKSPGSDEAWLLNRDTSNHPFLKIIFNNKEVASFPINGSGDTQVDYQIVLGGKEYSVKTITLNSDQTSGFVKLTTK